MSLASIASLLAIAPFGLGTREAALLLIAPVIAISGAQALAISGLIFFLTFINGVVGFIVWLAQPERSAISRQPSASHPQ
jgi:uncharacterized membrane protein YbhN (UPF0104 family)